jgi:uncharacterized iron-regulated protein
MRHTLLLLPIILAACATPPPFCPLPGHWVAPGSLQTVPDPAPEAAMRTVVLLGEQHDSAADHAWQLATIVRLYAANPGLVLGFEMFPRAAQPVLDRWVAGRLSEGDFLARTDWAHVWGFPPALYLPIFRFARDHRIPMLALNVSHRLVHLVAQKGWDAVPDAEREGVGTPAPPGAAYRASLADAMSGHGGPPMTPERLQHFIEAQLVWDRAMAEAVAAQRARAPSRLVVALIGAGHVENRYGVPRQLTALGIADVSVLVPAHHVCVPFAPHYADAVYIN